MQVINIMGFFLVVCIIQIEYSHYKNQLDISNNKVMRLRSHICNVEIEGKWIAYLFVDGLLVSSTSLEGRKFTIGTLTIQVGKKSDFEERKKETGRN